MKLGPVNRTFIRWTPMGKMLVKIPKWFYKSAMRRYGLTEKSLRIKGMRKHLRDFLEWKIRKAASRELKEEIRKLKERKKKLKAKRRMVK